MVKKVSGLIGRLLAFLLLASMLAISLYFQYYPPPFSAIPSKSMEPTFTVGDLILIKKISPASIKVGDIIVVNVPKPIRDKYNYPASIVHRVTKAEKSENNHLFRIKGDNNQEEDPFTVLPEDVGGEVSRSVSYLGYPVLFLHSKQGMYFIISAIAIYLIYILIDWFSKKTASVKKSLSSLFVGELIERTTVLEQKQEMQLQMVSQSLEKFTSAVEEYGVHLKSHTASVKGLAEGAHELKEAALKQNQILDEMKEILFGSSQAQTVISKHEIKPTLREEPSEEKLELLRGILKDIQHQEAMKQNRSHEVADPAPIFQKPQVKDELKDIIKEIERLNVSE
jgi:signal peptidase I